VWGGRPRPPPLSSPGQNPRLWSSVRLWQIKSNFKSGGRGRAPHGRLMPYPTAATRQVVFIDRAVVPQGGCCRSLLNQVVE